MLVAHLTSQISIMERTAVIYLTEQIPPGAFANIRHQKLLEFLDIPGATASI